MHTLCLCFQCSAQYQHCVGVVCWSFLSQSQCIPGPFCPSPRLRVLSCCIPAPFCPSLGLRVRVTQWVLSHCVANSMCSNPRLREFIQLGSSHYVQIPLYKRPGLRSGLRLGLNTESSRTRTVGNVFVCFQYSLQKLHSVCLALIEWVIRQWVQKWPNMSLLFSERLQQKAKRITRARGTLCKILTESLMNCVWLCGQW